MVVLRRSLVAAGCLLLGAIGAALSQTALRPDQICNPTCATPDITWAPGGAGYQIGSTIIWRTDSTLTPAFTSADGAKIVELTNPLATITSTLPDAALVANNMGDGFGFTIQVAAGTLTLSRTSPNTINGQPSIQIGPWQSAKLSSRTGKWYAQLSGGQAVTTPTITGVNLPSTGFVAGTAGTVGTATAAMTGGSFTGTWSLQTTGSDHAAVACVDYTTKFAIASTTGVLTNTTTAVTGANPGACIVATQAGATGSPYSQAYTLTGTGAAPTGTCPESTAFFARVWALPATLDGTIGTAAGPTNHLRAYDDLICGLKADGNWAVLDVLYVFATNTATGTNTAVANLNLVSSSFTALPTTGANAPGFLANSGYIGVDNSATVYIDTQFNTASSGGHWVNNAGAFMIWNLTNNTNVPKYVMMGNNTSGNTGINQIITNDGTYDNCWAQATGSGGDTFGPQVLPPTGSWYCDRESASFGSFYHNKVSVGTSSVAAGTPANNTVYILALHTDTIAQLGSARRIAIVGLGSPPIDAGHRDTYHNRLCNYLIAIGTLGSC
jgi:hypothetical protein